MKGYSLVLRNVFLVLACLFAPFFETSAEAPGAYHSLVAVCTEHDSGNDPDFMSVTQVEIFLSQQDMDDATFDMNDIPDAVRDLTDDFAGKSTLPAGPLIPSQVGTYVNFGERPLVSFSPRGSLILNFPDRGGAHCIRIPSSRNRLTQSTATSSYGLEDGGTGGNGGDAADGKLSACQWEASLTEYYCNSRKVGVELGRVYIPNGNLDAWWNQDEAMELLKEANKALKELVKSERHERKPGMVFNGRCRLKSPLNEETGHPNPAITVLNPLGDPGDRLPELEEMRCDEFIYQF